MMQLDMFGAPVATAPPTRRKKPKPPPSGKDRLIFLLYLDPPAADLAAAVGSTIARESGLTGRPIPRERLHVTLRHVGDFAGRFPEIESQLIAALECFQPEAFAVVVDEAMSFSGRPDNLPFVLLANPSKNPMLMAFQEALCAVLDEAGAGWCVDSGFAPHVTTTYDARSVPKRPIEPICWTAREFVLVHSPQGQGRHIPLARFPLR